MLPDANTLHNPPLRLLAAFQAAYPDAAPAYMLQAPERDMWLIAALTSTQQLHVAAPDLDGMASFSYQSAKLRRLLNQRPLPNWARYPAGVLLSLAGAGLDVDGVQMALAGDEPAGPRYEYTLGLTVAAFCFTLHAQAYTAATLIEIVDRVRRDYVEQP